MASKGKIWRFGSDAVLFKIKRGASAAVDNRYGEAMMRGGAVSSGSFLKGATDAALSRYRDQIKNGRTKA